MNTDERRKKEIIPFTEEHVKEYLDTAIRKWRKRKVEARMLSVGPDNIATTISECYVDAFQSVRTTLFGELLPTEEELCE